MKKKAIIVPIVITVIINSIILMVKKCSFKQVLQIAEFINYTFISFGLFYFGYKEIQKKAELVTNIVYRDYVFYLRIYNTGNKTAKNLSVLSANNKPFPYLTKLQSKNLGHIIPNEYIEIPIFIKDFGEKEGEKGNLESVWEDDDFSRFKIGETLYFSIKYDETSLLEIEKTKTSEVVINTAWMQGFAIFTPLLEKNREELVKSLKSMNSEIEKVAYCLTKKEKEITSSDIISFKKSDDNFFEFKFSNINGCVFSNIEFSRNFLEYEITNNIDKKTKPMNLNGCIELKLKGMKKNELEKFFDDYKSITQINFINENETVYMTPYDSSRFGVLKNVDLKEDLKDKNFITLIIEFSE